MASFNLFYNEWGRLRSGWRLLIFVGLYAVALLLLGSLFQIVLSLIPGQAAQPFLDSAWGWAIQALILFIPAAVVGWLCGAVLEGLPFRALGWALHRGWLRDLLVGSLIGAASLVLAGAIAAVPGGFSFTLAAAAMLPAVAKTLLVSALIFILAGAAEEVLFRGYALQTVLRSWPAWVALLPSSLAFAYVHLGNPNTVRGFTFVNTALAGVWLAVAYLRTRSLWFPLGVHWSWNWTMGAVVGLPVSGINEITPAPLMRAVDQGPAWLTGGSYGIEGGAACTLVLLLSTLFIWRTRLVSATEEMRSLTEKENPNPERRPQLGINEPQMGIDEPPADYVPPSP
ncbi:MAG TPA: type II CAAX endopeptidase family protein [Pyrinomonadaceae bacterium]|jgi:membrane protease YdiL (CAAX protease family)|nr:type II CAAX endopeptidase family protein [Pyrinomonadaceae bacterium]